MLVEEDDVRETGRLGRADQIGEDQVTSVETDGAGAEQTDLLGEGGEAGRGVARGGDEDARVDDTGEMRVFVVEVEFFGRRAVCSRLVVLVVLTERLVVCYRGIQRLARGERGLEFGPLFGNFCIAEGESSAVDVVATLAGLPTEHGGRVYMCVREREREGICAASRLLW